MDLMDDENSIVRARFFCVIVAVLMCVRSMCRDRDIDLFTAAAGEFCEWRLLDEYSPKSKGGENGNIPKKFPQQHDDHARRQTSSQSVISISTCTVQVQVLYRRYEYKQYRTVQVSLHRETAREAMNESQISAG